MEILFFILIGIVLVVRYAINQAKKNEAPTPRPRRPRPARRGPLRPWEQTPPPGTLEEALALADDRPEPPALRFSAVTDDEPEKEVPVVRVVPESPASVDQASELEPEPEPELEPEPEPELEPELKSQPELEPELPTPAVPTSTVYSASTPIYTPTSIYSGYTPTTLYESGSSVGGAQEPEEGDDDSEDPSPRAGSPRS